MPEALEGLYEILEISPSATEDEVRRAYRRKAKESHPDTLGLDASKEEKQIAEEKFKAIHNAYTILSDGTKRLEYDTRYKTAHSPPIPEVSPSIIQITDVKPGETQKTHFTIANRGGPYNKINISNIDSWVRITGVISLSQDDKLPLRVDIELLGVESGATYQEQIEISLDDVCTKIRVELVTTVAPTIKKDAATTQVYVPFPSGSNPYPYPLFATTSLSFDKFIKEILAIPATGLAGIIAGLLTAPLCLVSGIDLVTWLAYAPVFSCLLTLMTKVCSIGAKVMLVGVRGGCLPQSPYFTFKSAAIFGLVAVGVLAVIQFIYIL